VIDGYEGNARAFRIVTKLAVRIETIEGLNLTRVSNQQSAITLIVSTADAVTKQVPQIAFCLTSWNPAANRRHDEWSKIRTITGFINPNDPRHGSNLGAKSLNAPFTTTAAPSRPFPTLSAACSKSAMMIFFIFSIAAVARLARSGFGSLNNSSKRVGTTCHDSPQRSLSQPHWLSVPPFDNADQSLSTSP
jgi:hypothetical protein